MTDQKQKRIKPDELKLGQQHKATEEQAIVPPTLLATEGLIIIQELRYAMVIPSHQKNHPVIKASRHSTGFKDISTKMVEIREFWCLKGCMQLS